jgi:hypothetical protein
MIHVNVPEHVENEGAYVAAVQARILGNARKTFERTYERGAEVCSFLINGSFKEGSFLASMADSLANYGKLSPKQYDAVIKTIDTWAEKRLEREKAINEQKARSAFLGVVAEKCSFRCVVEKVLTVDCVAFSYYDRASQEVYLLRDSAGNRVIYKTKANFGFTFKHNSEFVPVAEGNTIEFTATIKAHSEYKGEKQTIITRPTKLSIEFN